MLSLKNIKKSYTTGDFTQVALNGIDLNFRESEFVAILGTSGSGKTTCLNVIGGLDNYDSGDLIINGKSTKEFKDIDWDAYRNNSVGFIFQSYNLITHLSIMDNVEMGMTLSGVSAGDKKKKALEVLERVGLKDHIHKKPNQLSGGQMQRVAIARALANDPDIILADEPTGALDTTTSVQIMDLIKEIAKDKLVIMVTHNPELAHNYADRTVEFKDGEVVSDSNPLPDKEVNSQYKLKKTKMSFLTALKLSGTNIKTKKGRTFLTAFASSIGIIGIALILSLSNGFDKQIKNFESGTLSTFPIMISQTSAKIDQETLKSQQSSMLGTSKDENDYPKDKVIYPTKSMAEKVMHKNILTKEYIDHIENIDPKMVSGISYTRMLNINLLKKQDDVATLIKTNSNNFTSYPKSLDSNSPSYLEQNYDVLAGAYPKGKNDIVLIVDKKNGVDETNLQLFGLDSEAKSIDFNKIIGTEFKAILNNDFYKSNGNFFTINGNPANLIDMYNNEKAISLNVVGILRAKEDIKISLLPAGFTYSDELSQFILNDAVNSDIVIKQKNSNFNVLTGEPLDTAIDPTNPTGMSSKETIMSALGATTTPYMISVYPKDFDAKKSILKDLDKYNEGKSETDKVVYNDLSGTVTEMSGGIMSAITMVLIAFSAISLIVSFIMVGIITYISVLERTKEIGVLRALGARKKDITRVFNAETFIIGACSGTLGIVIARLLVFPINAVIKNATELDNVAQLNPVHAITLIVISLVLTVLGGTIPAKMAAKKDPVEALRSE
ncbi:ATP-binding cassette domain-containing protein [Clostridium hydrogeniformans]|uniref:ABC transporter ATP-binding protein/permease n=1 Tax=Clostridium hydrogeniformans TaxID=349933 RepID=UPI00047FAE6D|nr:ABC transporter ATP-binding protein/permease [Clostridium hydrogeniformans]